MSSARGDQSGHDGTAITFFLVGYCGVCCDGGSTRTMENGIIEWWKTSP